MISRYSDSIGWRSNGGSVARSMRAYFGLAAWRATRAPLPAAWEKGDAGCPRAPKEWLAIVSSLESSCPAQHVAPAPANWDLCSPSSRKFRCPGSLDAVYIVSGYEPVHIKSWGSADCRRVASAWRSRRRLLGASRMRSARTHELDPGRDDKASERAEMTSRSTVVGSSGPACF